jgi:hypothetical protein
MTPDEVVRQIHAGLLSVLGTPEIRDQLTQLGFQVIGGSQADFERFLATTGHPLPKPVAGAEAK